MCVMRDRDVCVRESAREREGGERERQLERERFLISEKVEKWEDAKQSRGAF